MHRNDLTSLRMMQRRRGATLPPLQLQLKTISPLSNQNLTLRFFWSTDRLLFFLIWLIFEREGFYPFCSVPPLPFFFVLLSLLFFTAVQHLPPIPIFRSECARGATCAYRWRGASTYRCMLFKKLLLLLLNIYIYMSCY